MLPDSAALITSCFSMLSKIMHSANLSCLASSLAFSSFQTYLILNLPRMESIMVFLLVFRLCSLSCNTSLGHLIRICLVSEEAM